MCCVPTCRPVVDRCLDPVVIRGGGLTHTQAADTTKPTYGLPTFGFSRCSSIWGRLAGMPVLEQVSQVALPGRRFQSEEIQISPGNGGSDYHSLKDSAKVDASD